MKDWTQTLALAGLILGIAVFLQTGISQIGARLDRIDSRIEAIDGRVYELNERLTRVETLFLNSANPQ